MVAPVTVADRAVLIDRHRGFNARHVEPVLVRLHPEVDWPNGMQGGRVY